MDLTFRSAGAGRARGRPTNIPRSAGARVGNISVPLPASAGHRDPRQAVPLMFLEPSFCLPQPGIMFARGQG
ncbi:MAG: hypothetical protein ACREAC_08730, partial [Blastocatellia bacterium]